jgi:magnesium transporter
MSDANHTPSKDRRLAAIRAALREGSWRGAARMIAAMHPAEIARLIEALPPAQREVVWNFVEPETEGDVLVELNENVRQSLIDGMDANELLAAAENMELDDLADVVGDLPEAVSLQLVKSMDQQDRERLKTVLSYEPDTAGGLMNTDTVSVRADVTVEVVLRYLRMRGELPDKTDRLFVVDRNDRYLGTLALTRLLTEDPEKRVGDILDADAPRIAPEITAHDVARLFQDRDLVSAAVVDNDGKLLGRITVDDVVDVIREEAAHEVLSPAGLADEEDVFAGVMPSTRRRLVWLGINLVTAFLAAAVVSRFEGTIEKVAALAALMPIVASMGGIAGTQTVTLIIRGIALGQVEWVNARWLLWKEIGVGGLNGIIWALIVGSVTMAWYGTWKIAVIIAAATLINLLCAAAVGVIVPLALKRMRIDPALSAGVILTTFTDCVGFATLLGLGAIFLT